MPREKLDLEFYCTKDNGSCSGRCIDDSTVCSYLIVRKKIIKGDLYFA